MYYAVFWPWRYLERGAGDNGPFSEMAKAHSRMRPVPRSDEDPQEEERDLVKWTESRRRLDPEAACSIAAPIALLAIAHLGQYHQLLASARQAKCHMYQSTLLPARPVVSSSTALQSAFVRAAAYYYSCTAIQPSLAPS